MLVVQRVWVTRPRDYPLLLRLINLSPDWLCAFSAPINTYKNCILGRYRSSRPSGVQRGRQTQDVPAYVAPVKLQPPWFSMELLVRIFAGFRVGRAQCNELTCIVEERTKAMLYLRYRAPRVWTLRNNGWRKYSTCLRVKYIVVRIP